MRKVMVSRTFEWPKKNTKQSWIAPKVVFYGTM